MYQKIIHLLLFVLQFVKHIFAVMRQLTRWVQLKGVSSTQFPFHLHFKLKVRWNPKADRCAVDSPKKRTDEFDLFAVKSKKEYKTNSSVGFLGESMVRQSAFEINWPLVITKFLKNSFMHFYQRVKDRPFKAV